VPWRRRRRNPTSLKKRNKTIPMTEIPASSRKFDAGDVEPPINGADHENGSASGSEYKSPKKKRPVKTRPPASAGSRRR